MSGFPRPLAPSGAAGGDLTGTYPSPSLAAVGGGAIGPLGTATRVPVVTRDAKGRVTALTDIAITFPASSGGLLAALSYQPAADYTSGTGGTMSDVDAANLALTAMVPASGSVLIKLTAAYYKNVAASNGYAGIRIGTTNYSKQFVSDALSVAATRVCSSHILTGLTPGSTVLKMAFGADTQTLVIYANLGADCPVTMEAYAL